MPTTVNLIVTDVCVKELKASLDSLVLLERRVLLELVVGPVALERMVNRVSWERRERPDKWDRSVFRALSGFRELPGRGEIVVHRAPPAVQEVMVHLDRRDSEVLRASRVRPVRRVLREVPDQLAQLASLDLLEILGLRDREAFQGSRELLDPLDRLVHLVAQVCVTLCISLCLSVSLSICLPVCLSIWCFLY